MRLPYLQVAMEIIELAAPDLAVMLERSEEHVGWGLLKLFRWGLGRVPEGELPSAHALVRGPSAARLIAAAAGYGGDPEAYVDALCSVSPDPLLERTPEGIRICGLGRYDVAVEGAEVRSAKAQKAALVRWGKVDAPSNAPSIAQASVEHPPSIAQPMLGDAKTQIQTQTQIQKKEAAAAAGPRIPVTVEAPTKAAELWGCDDFWAWAQSVRQSGGLVAEQRPDPRVLSAWFSAALMTEGVTIQALKEAFYAFGEDPHWEKQRYPFRAFMKQWASFARKDGGHGSAA